MKSYVINLDSAVQRWEHMQEAFQGTSLELVRIPAVAGKELRLPLPEFDEVKYRRRHGRSTNIFEVACYLSHVKAMRAFLDSGDEHALICEDDLHPRPGLGKVLAGLMRMTHEWDIVRLTGLKLGKPVHVSDLGDGYGLMVPLHRVKGAGAYLLNRRAAENLVSDLLPMWLPFDHAIDREWVQGLRMALVAPFPISQTEQHFASNIQGNGQKLLSKLIRWRWTYPYQISNEVSHWIIRLARVTKLKLCFR